MPARAPESGHAAPPAAARQDRYGSRFDEEEIDYVGSEALTSLLRDSSCSLDGECQAIDTAPTTTLVSRSELAHGVTAESIDLSNDQVFSAIDLYMDQMFSQVITSSYPLPISSSEAGAPHENYSEKEMTGPLLTRDASAPAERQFPSARYEALVARVKVDSDLPGNYTLHCDPAETLWGQDFFN